MLGSVATHSAHIMFYDVKKNALTMFSSLLRTFKIHRRKVFSVIWRHYRIVFIYRLCTHIGGLLKKKQPKKNNKRNQFIELPCILNKYVIVLQVKLDLLIVNI